MNKLKKTILTIISIFILGGTYFYVQENIIEANGKRGPGVKDHPIEQEMRNEIKKTENEISVSLSVYNAKIKRNQVSIESRGVARSHFELAIPSEVSGKVIWINDNFESGNIIKKGDVIAKINPVDYEGALAEANELVAEEYLAYLEEERQGEQAVLEWKGSGLTEKPASPLVLREPQMKQAELALERSKKNVLIAKNNLENTVIKAPFDAIVVERNINPGEYIQSGYEIGSLNSTDKIEFSIPLSKKQWELVDQDNIKSEEQKAILSDVTSGKTWNGKIERMERHIDSESRQRSLIVSVENPVEQGLFSGEFAKANILGKIFDNVMKIPQSSISNEDKIFYVENNLLKVKTDFVIVASDSNYYYLEPWSKDSVKVVSYPLSVYSNLIGKKVEIKEIIGDE